jgi:hypothetical protein
MAAKENVAVNIAVSIVVTIIAVIIFAERDRTSLILF